MKNFWYNLKLIAISGVTIAFLQECSTGWKIHRVSIQGNPRYGRNDTVINVRTNMVFVIDSQMQHGHSKQVFYGAHSEDGKAWKWLPGNVVVPIKDLRR